MAWTLLAHASKKSDGSATTDAIDTTGADLLVVAITDYYSGCTVSDSKSNTWTPQTAYQGVAGYIETRIVWCVPGGGKTGSGHTFTANTTNPNSEIHVFAFSGANASPWDKENGAGSASAATLATGSITPAEDNSIIVSAASSTAVGASYTNDGGLTQYDGLEYGGGVGSVMGWLEQTYKTAINVTWNNQSGAWYFSAAIAAFKPVVTAPAQTVTLDAPIASAEAFGTTAVELGPITLYLSGIATAEAFGALQITGGARPASNSIDFQLYLGPYLNETGAFAGVPREFVSESVASAGTTVTVDQVTETDLAQALTVRKTKAIGQSTETDLAQAITRPIGQVVEVNQASEADSAGAVAWAPKHRLVNQASEVDLAQSISHGGQVITVGQSAETDIAQAISKHKRKTIGQATETDAAQAVAWSPKHRKVGTATETDTAQHIGRAGAIIVAVEQAIETDLARPITVRSFQIVLSDVPLSTRVGYTPDSVVPTRIGYTPNKAACVNYGYGGWTG